jgi:signal transduction histidine kinase/DNA-binding response OmpR family regulator
MGHLAEGRTPRLDPMRRPRHILCARSMSTDTMSAEEPTQGRIERLLTLFEDVAVLTASSPSGGLVASIAESAARLFAADSATVSLMDTEAQSLVPIYTWPDAALRLTPTPGSRSQALLVGRSGIVGTIEVCSHRADAFNAEDERILAAFARQAAATMESGRLIQELSAGKHDWEEAFDAISEGICVRDELCHIVRANRALSTLVGRPAAQILGARLCDEVPQLAATCNVCHSPSEWDDAHAAGLGLPIEIKGGAEGSALWTVTDFPARVSDRGIVSWVTLIKDVTIERRTQEALVRSEQLRAIGELASGVAHDFNNLLSTILHRSELSLSADLPPDLRRSIETIRSAALDGVATVRRIQEYSRVRQDRKDELTDPAAALAGAIELSRHRWADASGRTEGAIRLVTEIQDMPRVRGNPSELREVFMNLILNAVDAMPEGGTLSIRGSADTGRAVVKITDDGVGMGPDVLSRIFDPFYSTKGERGNGLGLSIAYGIVSRSGGDISATSKPGEGTTFIISLPSAVDQPAPPLSTVEPPLTAIQGVRILLLDDDPAVRDGLADLLRQDGHTVDAYEGARPALANYRRGSYDCVITDLGMPDLDGWDFARELRVIDSQVPLVLLTGWQAEISREHIDRNGVSAVLSKPCSQAELRRVIASLTQPAAPLTSVPTSLSVLVVDDQPLFAEAVADRLRLEGCAVRLADSGAAGLAAAREQVFDAALIDFRLPDISGLEVATQLRGMARRPYLILTSGLALDPEDPHLVDVVDHILLKPWQPAELRAALSLALEHASPSEPAAALAIGAPP